MIVLIFVVFILGLLKIAGDFHDHLSSLLALLGLSFTLNWKWPNKQWDIKILRWIFVLLAVAGITLLLIDFDDPIAVNKISAIVTMITSLFLIYISIRLLFNKEKNTTL